MTEKERKIENIMVVDSIDLTTRTATLSLGFGSDNLMNCIREVVLNVWFAEPASTRDRYKVTVERVN
jgi:hypothetical protein